MVISFKVSKQNDIKSNLEGVKTIKGLFVRKLPKHGERALNNVATIKLTYGKYCVINERLIICIQ